MAAHCAAVTKNIRLGSGVVVAPLYTPARLIADIAMVDQLSNGRLNVGIGAGYQQFEFERFSMPLENNKERTLEIIDMIELGLKQKKFSYDGQFYQQPMTAISQRPVQSPMPPLWVTSMDPTLMARAVKGDHHLFVSGSDVGHAKLKSSRAIVDKLARTIRAASQDPATREQWLMVTFSSSVPTTSLPCSLSGEGPTGSSVGSSETSVDGFLPSMSMAR